MNRGIHTKQNNGETTEWLTPPEIIEALGPFDLDPCCLPKMPWKTAGRMLRVRGLNAKWRGRVWLNPPYGHGSSRRWLKKMAEHGNGIALVASRTEVRDWFIPYVWESASAVLFIFGRLYFYRPDGTKAPSNAGHGSVLAAYGDECAERLRMCGIRGKYIDL